MISDLITGRAGLCLVNMNLVMKNLIHAVKQAEVQVYTESASGGVKIHGGGVCRVWSIKPQIYSHCSYKIHTKASLMNEYIDALAMCVYSPMRKLCVSN